MPLLFLSKYLAYAFSAYLRWESITFKSISNKEVFKSIFTVRFLSDDAILLLSTWLSFFGFMKSAFDDAIFSEMHGFLLHFVTTKQKKSKCFILSF